MLELKEYVTTYLNYVVRFTKPPLTIWAQALCMQLFGHNEFAGRFPGAGSCCHTHRKHMQYYWPVRIRHAVRSSS